MAQGLDRVQVGGAAGWIGTEKNAHGHRNRECQNRRPGCHDRVLRKEVRNEKGQASVPSGIKLTVTSSLCGHSPPVALYSSSRGSKLSI